MTQNTYNMLSKRLKQTELKVKKINHDLHPKPPWPSIKDSKYEISLRKCIVCPQWKNKTVLSDSSWKYVDIFLNRSGQKEALTFWHQAESFFKASEDLSSVSKPLTVYYCFLNATKALLTSKGIPFDLKHGASGVVTPGKLHLQNEKSRIYTRGILSSLCYYLAEPVAPSGEVYNLKDILYNLQFIHRSFILTYRNMAELFIPIDYSRFVYDKANKKAWLEIELEEEHSNNITLNRLTDYEIDDRYDNEDYYTLKKKQSFHWDAPRNIPTPLSQTELQNYYNSVRKEMRYIYPYNTWYIKRKDITSGVINRGTLTLTFAAMHRLSELSRYNPERLKKHLESNAGWLLSEFIDKAGFQFIDQIASEITGDDFRPTSFR